MCAAMKACTVACVLMPIILELANLERTAWYLDSGEPTSTLVMAALQSLKSASV